MSCAGKNLYNNEHVAIKLVIHFVIFLYMYEYPRDNSIKLVIDYNS